MHVLWLVSRCLTIRVLIVYNTLNSAPLFTIADQGLPGGLDEVPSPPGRALGRPPWPRSLPLTPVPEARAPSQTARTPRREIVWHAAAAPSMPPSVQRS